MPVDFAQMVLDLPDVGNMHSKHSEHQNLIQEEEQENDMVGGLALHSLE